MIFFCRYESILYLCPTLTFCFMFMKYYNAYAFFKTHLHDEFRVTIYIRCGEEFSISGNGRSLAILVLRLPNSTLYNVTSRLSK